MYKTIWIPAPLKQEDDKFTNVSVDGEKLSDAIELVCNNMEKIGYKLVGNPTPMLTGMGIATHATLTNKTVRDKVESYGGGWGCGYGFSYTSGVTLLFCNDKSD